MEVLPFFLLYVFADLFTTGNPGCPPLSFFPFVAVCACEL